MIYRKKNQKIAVQATATNDMWLRGKMVAFCNIFFVSFSLVLTVEVFQKVIYNCCIGVGYSTLIAFHGINLK